jgi:hypothetical protein
LEREDVGEVDVGSWRGERDVYDFLMGYERNADRWNSTM